LYQERHEIAFGCLSLVEGIPSVLEYFIAMAKTVSLSQTRLFAD